MASAVEQELEGSDGLRRRDAVPVVDHQRRRGVGAVQLVDERAQYVPFGLVAVRVEDLAQFAREDRPDLLHGLDEVREEPQDVVVVAVHRQPRDRHSLGGEYVAPLRREGGLTEAGGGVDGDETASSACPQERDQTAAFDQGT